MKKKLIEVALPLEAINRESVAEKWSRQGHPSSFHLWWARRPLAACRAVLFSSLVVDPSSRPDRFPTEEAQEAERQRLFRIIEDRLYTLCERKKWAKEAFAYNSLVIAWPEIARLASGTPAEHLFSRRCCSL